MVFAAQIGRQGLPPDRVILHDQDVMRTFRSRTAGFSPEARHSYPFTIFYATFIDGAKRVYRDGPKPAGSRSGSVGVWNPLAWGRRTWTLIGIGALGAIAGVIAWGGFNTAMEATNSIQFCVSCHEMRDTVYQEYLTSIHYKNPSGRQGCLSRLPRSEGLDAQGHSQGPGHQRALAQGPRHHRHAGEIPGAARASLAKDVWKTMKDTDSRECRNCHSFEAMDFAPAAAGRRTDAESVKEGGQTCIDCHKGIAHKLPDMAAGFKAIFDESERATKTLNPSSGRPSTRCRPSRSGSIEPKSADGRGRAASSCRLTPLEVLDRDGDWLKVKFAGWQQQGAERMVYAAQGKRIFAAALGPDAVDKVGARQDDERSRHRPEVDRRRASPRGSPSNDLSPIGKLLGLWRRDVQRQLRHCATRCRRPATISPISGSAT